VVVRKVQLLTHRLEVVRRQTVVGDHLDESETASSLITIPSRDLLPQQVPKTTSVQVASEMELMAAERLLIRI